jgi:hypothetical protein
MFQNATVLYEAYNQIKLYRSYLMDSSAGGLWRHILLGGVEDQGHWATGEFFSSSPSFSFFFFCLPPFLSAFFLFFFCSFAFAFGEGADGDSYRFCLCCLFFSGGRVGWFRDVE